MKGIYRFSALIIAALVAIPAGFGQSQSSASDTSGGTSQQEAVDLMIIRESVKEDSLEQKLIALEFTGSLLEQGDTNDAIRIALQRLSLEGTNAQNRESGRIKNDFPQVRREAARQLGALGTEEAKIALLQVCISDNEPLVLQEAVRALGEIGIDNDGEVVGTIVWVTNKYNNSVAPDNFLALAAIDALDKLAKNNGVRADGYHLLVTIAEGNYASPVKERAKQSLANIRSTVTNNSKEKKNQGQPK